MAFRKSGRLPKPAGFQYKPRFYDEKKEELDSRINRHERLRSNDPEAIKEGISGAFRRGGSDYFTSSRIRQEQTRKSNLMLLAIIMGLTAVSYILLTVYLPALAGES